MSEPMVAVAVVRGRRGVLVGLRADGTPPWVFVGGKVELGETPAEAAVRETAEETGLAVDPGAEIGRRVHPRTGRLMIYIACRPVDSAQVEPVAQDELTEARWVGVDELDALMPDLYGPVREFLRGG